MHKARTADNYSGRRRRKGDVGGGIQIRGQWKMVCRRADGSIKWVEEWENLVVNVGLNHYLDVALSAATQITSWFLGLKGAGSAAAGDTMASHGGWSEVTAYSEATRQAWTDAGASGQSISNAASPAVFTSDTNGTSVAGAFLTSNNTKGGTTGTLMAAGDFALAKTIDSGETLEVTATFTMAAA